MLACRDGVQSLMAAGRVSGKELKELMKKLSSGGQESGEEGDEEGEGEGGGGEGKGGGGEEEDMDTTDGARPKGG